MTSTTRTKLFPAIEWPTVGIAILIYGGWIAVTAFHREIPALGVAMLGAVLIAWHGSLQHETIHGHPTGNRLVDGAIGCAPLSLWLPYAIYRRTHIAHHATPEITDPFDDPESQYLAAEGGLRHRLAQAEATLAGRLILGPPIRILSFLGQEAGHGRRRPLAAVRTWGPHLLAMLPILWWLDRVGFSLSAYFLTFVYPGTALSLLRSFAEHRADPERSACAALVDRAGPLGLLFLNNNLHAVHHARPGLAWYALPAFYRAHRGQFPNAPFYRGYGEIVRRHLFRAHDALVHPGHGARS